MKLKLIIKPSQVYAQEKQKHMTRQILVYISIAHTSQKVKKESHVHQLMNELNVD